MGACLFVHHNLLDNPFHGMPWNDPYLGMEMANISEAVSRQDVVVTKMPFEELVKKTARLLADGKIVGWLQGRCESGPRALGNRSLLAHPGVPAMKDMINKKIKHREFWRPFAPACLEEEVANWIDIDHPQPYMLEAPLVKEKRRGVIPAVTHVDGTARVQTVNEQQNARFYALIKAFHELTGIPMLLNTSFNDKGFPLCNDAHVAVELLKSTGMDYLVIEDYLIATTEG
ncbi:MAG: hypothetical protein GTN93_23135 [Anaerolineae bacterium]|nr:hypothetical protein [Anaerolineae bacterium]